MSATQLPASTVAIGFGTGTIAAMIRSSQTHDATGNIEYVVSEAGDDSVAVVSNVGERIVAEGVLKNGQARPDKGDVVTIGSAVYLVEEAKETRGPTVCRLSLTLYKPDATTWATGS